MRITSKMTTRSTLANIQTNNRKLDELSKQLSSGKRIEIPEDDPTGTIKAMSYRSNLNEIDQYVRNVDNAKATLDSTDNALGQVTNILQRVRELSVQAANDTYEKDARDAIADEIDQLLDQVVGVANTKVGNRYIFGGFKTDGPPFKKYTGKNDSAVGGPGEDLTRVDGSVRDGINSEKITVVNYSGDTGKFQTEIDENVKTTFNISGEAAFLDGENLFQNLIDLRDNIYREEPTDEDGDGQSIEDSLDSLDRSINNILRSRSEVGAKLHRMDQAKEKLENQKINVSKLLGAVEDTDVTKAIMDLKVQESVQKMSLSVGARVIKPTLIDYLR
ncbi:MAG: flagellar hook-associated protein FlgL [Fusobacteriota bacterium]